MKPRTTAVWFAACAAAWTALFAVIAAQDGTKTVADGIYTDAQAARGALVYEASCSNCHRPDLSGGTGPSLKEQRFARDFAGKDLKALFTKISSTMPQNAPASLGDAVYVDVVAHVLRENGFPAGGQDLTIDGMDGYRIVPGKPKPPPPVGDFSYVEIVGCLAGGSQNSWNLTHATEPVSVTATPGADPPPLTTPQPLGTQTIHLLDALAYAPETHIGQKMRVRGLLIRLPGEQRMTISSIEMVAPACSE